MRRRLLNRMLTEQEERNRSQAVLSVLVPAVNLSQNESAAFQGAAQSSPAGSVPPAQPAPFKRGPGRPKKQ